MSKRSIQTITDDLVGEMPEDLQAAKTMKESESGRVPSRSLGGSEEMKENESGRVPSRSLDGSDVAWDDAGLEGTRQSLRQFARERDWESWQNQTSPPSFSAYL